MRSWQRTEARKTSSTAGAVVRKDLRRRRKTNFTPEYQDWLSRQNLKKQGRTR